MWRLGTMQAGQMRDLPGSAYVGTGSASKEEEKKVKISITLNPELNARMERELTNKSRLIEKLLTEHYEKKNM